MHIRFLIRSSSGIEDPMSRSIASLLLIAAAAAAPLSSPAATVTFAEFAGLADCAAMPTLPQRLPEGVTAVCTGLLAHTLAGDTPVSVTPAADRANADTATV
jgi:hypothetical protein